MRAGSKTGLRKSPGGAGGKAKLETKTEIEIKLRVADLSRILRQLARLRAELIAARVHEMNTLYDTVQGDLLRQGRMLRVRVERPASRSKGAGQIQRKTGRVRAREGSGFSALLTFKGPVGAPRPGAKRAAEKMGKKKRAAAYKIREEHEIRVSDQEEVGRIIEGLGLRPCFRYEKFRTTYRLPGIGNLKLEVDETPIGLFLELEGPRREIDRAAARLGFGPGEYITKSYGALFMEERGAGRGLKSGKRAGAKREAGKASHDEPIDEPTRERTDELGRFSGLGDMLFSSSR
jgi:adenylate cyclase class IV